MYNLVTTEDEARIACQKLDSAEALGLDCETTDLEPRRGDLRLVQVSNGTDTFIFDMKYFPLERGVLQPLKTLLESDKHRKIAHNGKFEYKWLSTKAGICPHIHFDTMLADIIVAAATVGINGMGHGLDNVARRYANIILPKEEQRSDWSGELREEQLIYAAKDASSLIPIRPKLIQKLTQHGLQRVAKLEFDAVPAIADIELAGFPVDKQLYSDLCDHLEKERNRTERALQELLTSTQPHRGTQTSLFEGIAEVEHSAINLNSYIQVSKAFRALGVPIFNTKDDETSEKIEEYVRKKLPFARTTGAEDIKALARSYPVLQVLLDHRGAEKLFSSYGPSILELIENNRIYADFFQLFAETGRMSCRNPNLQQVPNIQIFRSCFVAPKGYKLIVADYSQIELRILADYSQDPSFLKVYRDGLDLHSMTASKLVGVSYEELEAGKKDKYKDVRGFAKTLNFGIAYGMGAESYAQRTGRNISDAEKDVMAFREGYKGATEWLNTVAKQALRTLTASTRSGRKVKFSPPTADGNTPESKDERRKQEGAIKRNGKNTPIQGSSSDITKVALYRVHKALKESGLDARIVNVVHDELDVESAESCAEEVAKIVQREMILAGEEFVKTVPILVEVGIYDSWGEK